MNVIKCDRCGVVCDAQNPPRHINIDSDRITEYRVDLCDKCFDKLHQFLHNTSCLIPQ